MEPRLTAGLRVAALLRRADLEGRAAYVVHRGDDTAGALAGAALAMPCLRRRPAA